MISSDSEQDCHTYCRHAGWIRIYHLYAGLSRISRFPITGDPGASVLYLPDLPAVGCIGSVPENAE